MEAELTQEEMFAVFDGMEEVNRKMADEITASAPRCHMRSMMYEETDSVDGYYENYWECSVCGHTKDSQERRSVG